MTVGSVPAPRLSAGMLTAVQAIDPVLELVDLVLVLAVDPGWRGQAPAVNTRRRVSEVRDLAGNLGRLLEQLQPASAHSPLHPVVR